MFSLTERILIILSVLVGLLLLFLFVHFVNDLFHFLPIHIDSIKPCDKFEVYRDLLVILLTTLGIIGYIAYTELRDRVAVKVQKSVEKRANLTFGELYHRMSAIHFLDYERIDRNYIRRERGFNEYLELAIDEADEAVSLCEKAGKELARGLTSIYRINLAYHLAVRCNKNDKDKALEMVKKNYEEAGEAKPDQKHNIYESKIWVILRYSDDEKEREDAKKHLQDLMYWKDVPRPWKKEMKEKYLRNFQISLEIP